MAWEVRHEQRNGFIHLSVGLNRALRRGKQFGKFELCAGVAMKNGNDNKTVGYRRAKRSHMFFQGYADIESIRHATKEERRTGERGEACQ